MKKILVTLLIVPVALITIPVCIIALFVFSYLEIFKHLRNAALKNK